MAFFSAALGLDAPGSRGEYDDLIGSMVSEAQPSEQDLDLFKLGRSPERKLKAGY